MTTTTSEHRSEHHIGARHYAWCLLALLVLSALTLGAAFLPLGIFAMPLALAIAAIKAVLVALYFMHLIDQPPSHWIAAVSGVLLLAILIALACADVLTRG